MSYLLDTNICIYALNGDPHVARRMRAKSRADVAVSVITEAELRTGVQKSASPLRNGRKLQLLLETLAVVEFTSDDAAAYADVRTSLERAGTPIGPLDTLIAAQALARGFVLVTNNEREFRRIPHLNVENWARPSA